jgi:hypothetical protein
VADTAAHKKIGMIRYYEIIIFWWYLHIGEEGIEERHYNK